MRVSACAIVKNEENNLPLWLESMKRIADELVVVDTGSTDGTVELAMAAGARVEHFKWVNDFAAAKNFAIEKAEGDWIIFLDADEYFTSDDCPRVRAAIEKYHGDRAVAGLMFLLVNIDRITGRDQGSSAYLIRCFRNVSWLRYVGSIHEELRNLSGRGTKIMQYVKDAVIYHTGYSKEIFQDKIRRNLEILIESEGERELDDYYIADCYYSLGEYEDAILRLKRLISRNVKIMGMENDPYTILINSLMLANHPSEEIYDYLRKAVKKFPHAAEFCMMWGLQDWNMGNYAGAEQRYMQSLELYRLEQQGVKKKLLSSHSVNFLPIVYLHMGMISAWKGRREMAAGYFAEVLKLQPRNVPALHGLCRLLSSASAEEVIAALNEIYDKKAYGEFLAVELAELGMGETALYYEECSGKQLFDVFEHRLLSGNIYGAAENLKYTLEKLNVREIGRKIAWGEILKLKN